jgi:hypothetical protein
VREKKRVSEVVAILEVLFDQNEIVS